MSTEELESKIIDLVKSQHTYDGYSRPIVDTSIRGYVIVAGVDDQDDPCLYISTWSLLKKRYKPQCQPSKPVLQVVTGIALLRHKRCLKM